MRKKPSEVEVENLLRLVEEFRSIWGPQNRRPSPSLKKLTLAQARCLFFIIHHENCTMGELCKSQGVSLSTASELVERLVAAGFAMRSRDKNDRRVVRLKLTRRGRHIHNKFQALKKEKISEMLASFSAREHAEFTSALQTIIRLSGKAHGEKV